MKKKIFQDWKIGRYRLTSPDGKYILWIGGGFICFKDYDDGQVLVGGLSFWGKYKLWREYKRESKRRSNKFLNDLMK